MPITVQVPDGMFTEEQKAEIFLYLTDTILDLNGAADNDFAVRHLIGDVVTVPEGMSFAARRAEPFVNVTVRAPIFSLDTIDKQQRFVERMTDFIQDKAAGRLERDRIYVNMIHGDAFWGIGGVAYTNGHLLTTLVDRMKTTG